MGYSLLDISEITGLPIYGLPYDEYVSSSKVIEEGSLLKDLVVTHQAALLHSKAFHNKKKCCTFTTWVDEFIGLKVPSEFSSRK